MNASESQPLWHAEPIEESLQRLKTRPEGLSAEERETRLADEGPNALKKQQERTAWHMLLAQFDDVLIWLLLGATALSAILGEYLDASAMLSIVFLSAILGLIQDYRAEQAARALAQLTTPLAQIWQGDQRIEVDASSLVPGDVLVLEAGDLVPADARFLEAHQIRAEEASLTGESQPVDKESGVLPEDTVLSEQANMCFLGTAIVHGEGKAVVVATGMATQMGQIASGLEQAEAPQTPLQKKLKSLARQIGLAVMLLIALTLIAMLLTRPQDVAFQDYLMKAVLFSLSLAVAAVPSSLPAIATIGLAMGARSLAEKKMLIKRLPAAESLGSVTFICSDKTGTLTQNEMTVTRLFVDDNEHEITGTGYGLDGELKLDGAAIEPTEGVRLALRIGALCNNAQRQEPQDDTSGGEAKPAILGDPTEGALLVAAAKLDCHDEEYQKISEFPFDAKRRKMTVIARGPDEEAPTAYTKGAPGTILESCDRIYRSGEIRPITEEDKAQIERAREGLASQALRVLGLSYQPATDPEKPQEEIEQGQVFVGLAGMLDPPRPGASASVKAAKEAGIKVMMITGDHALTAQAIGRSIGLIDASDDHSGDHSASDDATEALLTGQEVEQLDDETLAGRLEQTRVIARALPAHKLRIVKMLQRHGHIVAMTGDGVNDAPALKQADIGVAMGQTGTDVAKESSDAILADDRFETLVLAIAEGRNIYDKMRKSIRYLLSCNWGEVCAVMLTVLLRLPLPLLPLQILLMNLITDGLPALALGVEPADDTIMKRPPRDPKKSPLTKDTLWLIGVTGLIMGLGTLGLFYMYLPEGADKARTVAFCALVVFEMFAVFAARKLDPIRFKQLFSNGWLWAAVVGSLVLQVLIVYLPPLQNVFHTTALGWSEWGMICLAGLLAFFTIEGSKRLFPST